MKKNFKFYVLIWFILFCLFNALSFVIPAWPTCEKFTASFWIGWGATIFTFFAQLVCAWIAFNEDSAKKTFYNISLLTVSYTGLIAMFVVAMICIVITPLPYWAAAIACSLVLIVNAFAVIKTKMAIDIVNDVDKKVENATAFIYDMRAESESVLARAKTDDAKALCKKVRDAFKYSDPMSSAELTAVEAEIKVHFDLLKKSIVEDKMANATAESEEILALVSERNNACKRLK